MAGGSVKKRRRSGVGQAIEQSDAVTDVSPQGLRFDRLQRTDGDVNERYVAAPSVVVVPCDEGIAAAAAAAARSSGWVSGSTTFGSGNTGSGLLGSSRPSASQAPSGSANTGITGGGLFGNTISRNGLGGTFQGPITTSGSLFGKATASAQSFGSLFGSTPANLSQGQGNSSSRVGGLFGTTQPATGGLSGRPTYTAPPTSGVLGNTTSTGGLFESSTQTGYTPKDRAPNTNTGSILFSSSDPFAPGSLFGPGGALCCVNTDSAALKPSQQPLEASQSTSATCNLDLTPHSACAGSGDTTNPRTGGTAAEIASYATEQQHKSQLEDIHPEQRQSPPITMGNKTSAPVTDGATSPPWTVVDDPAPVSYTHLTLPTKRIV